MTAESGHEGRCLKSLCSPGVCCIRRRVHSSHFVGAFFRCTTDTAAFASGNCRLSPQTPAGRMLDRCSGRLRSSGGCSLLGFCFDRSLLVESLFAAASVDACCRAAQSSSYIVPILGESASGESSPAKSLSARFLAASARSRRALLVLQDESSVLR
jgi:hypothetical protein